MLRRQKHVLSQSTTPFACTLFGRHMQRLFGGSLLRRWPDYSSNICPPSLCRQNPSTVEVPKGPSRTKNSTESKFATGRRNRYGDRKTLRRALRSAWFYSHEDVNGEKLTVKKWWILGAVFFSRFTQSFSRFIRDINGEKTKHLVIDDLFHG